MAHHDTDDAEVFSTVINCRSLTNKHLVIKVYEKSSDKAYFQCELTYQDQKGKRHCSWLTIVYAEAYKCSNMAVTGLKGRVFVFLDLGIKAAKQKLLELDSAKRGRMPGSPNFSAKRQIIAQQLSL